MEHSKVFSAIQAAYPKLTAAERSVADFFLQNRERGDFSSKAVAARLYVSEASLSRFAQKCGFKGYREFIYEYQRPFDEGSPFLSFSQVTKDVLARYQQLLDSSSRLVDEGQMRRVSQMLANSQRVYIYGMGSSGFAAREFALRLMRTGLLVEAITDSHMIRMNAVLVDETVTVVAITLSGATEEVLWGVREARRRGEDVRPLACKCLQLCAWCCLFFIAIPFGIYFAAFLPITTLSHNGGKLWWAFWNYQTTMFNYHAHLEATHSFASPWYEWPFDIRPIWYFAQDNWNGYSTISSFGNPLLWWGCLPALAAAAYLWWKERPRWAAVVLAGFGSVYLPWVLVPRLTFIYHYFTAVPFLVVALCGVFSLLYEKGPFARRLTFPGGLECQGATLLLAAFAAGCLLLFAVYFPVLSGAPTTREYADALELFDSWYFS